jgi:hypothetical protein
VTFARPATFARCGPAAYVAQPATACNPISSTQGGFASPCARSYYNPLAGQYLRSACLSCPLSTTTESDAATSVDECLCNTGYYNSRSTTNDSVECSLCPVGSTCVEAGTSLASLPLKVSSKLAVSKW